MSQSKLQMIFLSFDIEKTLKFILGRFLQKLNQRHNRRKQVRSSNINAGKCENEICVSIQLQKKNKKIFRLISGLRWNVIATSHLCLASTMQIMVSIYSYLTRYAFILNNETLNLLSLRKRTSSFCSNLVIFGYPIWWTFLVEQQILINFEGIQNFKKKKILALLIVWLPWQNAKITPYDAFCSKLRSYNPLKAEYFDYVDPLKSGMTRQQTVIKLNLSKPSITGIENYHYLQEVWTQEQMRTFEGFFSWYNKKRFPFNFGGNAKNDFFLPRQRYQINEAWLYVTKPGQHLSTEN